MRIERYMLRTLLVEKFVDHDWAYSCRSHVVDKQTGQQIVDVRAYNLID